MNNPPKKALDVAKIVAPIVNSRDAVRALEKTISKEKARCIDLDFRNVEFVSRSATHEFLTMKEVFARKVLKTKIISFVNLNQNVISMFRVTAANRAVPKLIKPKFKAKTISIENLMTDSHKATA